MTRIKAYMLQPLANRRCDLFGCTQRAIVGVGQGYKARAYCKMHTEMFATALQRLDAERERRRKELPDFDPEVPE